MELIELTFNFSKLMDGVSKRVSFSRKGVHILNEYPWVRCEHKFISAN